MAKEKKTYEVNGIFFTEETEAKKAQREWEGITHIKEQNDLGNIHITLALYNKLSEKQLLTTAVGKSFLEELKNRLLQDTLIDNQQIYGYNPEEEKQKEQEAWAEKMKQRDAQKKKPEKADDAYKYKFYNSLILNIALILAILFMLYITTNSKNVNIINYENRLVDKYVAWESVLTEWEKSLDEREKDLNKK